MINRYETCDDVVLVSQVKIGYHGEQHEFPNCFRVAGQTFMVTNLPKFLRFTE